jgi:acid phosphatase
VLQQFNATAGAGTDTAAPSVPTGLSSTPGTGQVKLSWNASSDPDDAVASYNIYRDGARIASSTSPSFTDTGLTNGRSYSYQVSAVDTHGNESGSSSALSAAPQPPHIMVIMEENHSYSTIIGNSSASYINSLATKYGLATNWWGVSHPSEPNYLALMSGSIWDNPSDLTPQSSCPSTDTFCSGTETYAGPTLADQLAGAGIGWKAYLEDMASACDLTDTFGPGNYDVNHNPFIYFNEIRSNPAQCNQDVPFNRFAGDLANNTAPPFIYVAPSLLDDMHNGTIQQADTWLQNTMNEVLASQWYAQGGVVIITWDEGEGGTPSDQIPAIVVAANNAGKRLSTFGNHYGTLRAIEEAYGLPLLGHAADSTVGDLTNLF